MFISLLSNLVNTSNHTKRVPLSNQKCEIQPILFNLHLNEWIQSRVSLSHYPFSIKLDRCVGSCNTLDDFSNKICIQTKTEDLNLILFNIITRISESKTLTKDISCEVRYTFGRRKCNSNHWWNNYKSRCE